MKKPPEKEVKVENGRIKPPEFSVDCPRSPEEREIRYRGYTEKLRQKEET